MYEYIPQIATLLVGSAAVSYGYTHMNQITAKLTNVATRLTNVGVNTYVDLKWRFIQATPTATPVEDPIPCLISDSVNSQLPHIMYSYGGERYLFFGDRMPKLDYMEVDTVGLIIIHKVNGERTVNTDENLRRYIIMCLGPNGSAHAPLCTMLQLRSIDELQGILKDVDRVIVNMDDSMREFIIQ
jgi:hypothetical protein